MENKKVNVVENKMVRSKEVVETNDLGEYSFDEENF